MRKLFAMALAAICLTACQETLEEKAAKEAQLYTKKNCPAQMGDNLRMDSLCFEPATHTLHFHYTMTGIADSVGLLDKEVARNALLTELKNTTSMMAYKEAGFQFGYTYRSEKNPDVTFFDVVFTQEDYQK